MNDAAGSGAAVGGPCGACKFLRRKCVPGCVFAPYFDSEQGAAHFSAVHKVFGASNASKLLLHIPAHRRHDAVVTMCYEAQARLRDPVYGCVSHIFALQQQVMKLQAELSYLQAHLATLQLPQPPPQPPALLISPPPISAADIPVISSVPATYDLSLILDPTAQASASSWAMQRRTLVDHSRWQFGTGSSSAESGELHALAHELLQRQGSPAPPATGGSPLRSLSR